MRKLMHSSIYSRCIFYTKYDVIQLQISVGIRNPDQDNLALPRLDNENGYKLMLPYGSPCGKYTKYLYDNHDIK